MPSGQQGGATMTEKNWALLDCDRSPLRTDSIIELIASLKRELGKGEGIYTSAEREKLAAKLADYELMLDRLNSP
jgi:hypothetical protein